MKFNHLSLAVIALLIGGCKDKNNTIHPQYQPIVESVYASATIKAAQQYTLYPGMSGRILNFTATEGDRLSAGHVIAHLDNTSAALSASTAGEAVALSKVSNKQLQEISAQLSTAVEQAKLDSLNYKRQQNLWAQNIGSLSQLEAKKLAAAASKNAVKALQAKLSVAQSQIAFNQKQAQNNQGTAAKSLSEFDVKADISGEVFQLLAEPGEWVSPQKPLAILGNSSDFLIHMEVDEVDIAKVKVGQSVVIGLDAYKGRSFKGHVSRIIPIMNAKSQSFEVEAVFDEKPDQLYPGLSAEVNIVIAEKAKSLLIPITCIDKNNVVKTKSGDVTVKTGLRNLEFVEILEGLTEQSEILVPKSK